MGRHRHLFALALALGVVGGCGSSGSSTSTAASTVTPQDAGLPAGAATLTAAQTAAATALATRWSAALVAAHPELTGISAPTITPVYLEHSAGPVGARALFRLPAVVPELELDLVRLKHDQPETVPSQVTNLRALEMIYFFDGDQVVHVGVVPDTSDASDPDAEAVVRPLDPEAHRSTEFGGNE